MDDIEALETKEERSLNAAKKTCDLRSTEKKMRTTAGAEGCEEGPSRVTRTNGRGAPASYRKPCGDSEGFVCESCEVVFPCLAALSAHCTLLHQASEAIHDGYQCPAGCGKLFGDAEELVRHHAHAHPGRPRLGPDLEDASGAASCPSPRTFLCRYCLCRMGRLKLLLEHERMHTGSRPFLCHNGCRRNFRRHADLRMHQRRCYQKGHYAVLATSKKLTPAAYSPPQGRKA